MLDDLVENRSHHLDVYCSLRMCAAATLEYEHMGTYCGRTATCEFTEACLLAGF